MDFASLILTLVLSTSASWARMFIALFLSILVSLGIGIYAARSEVGGRIILPILDIFQTLPILAFFPFVIFIFVGVLPGFIGINAAVIFLIVTSMMWNISFGVYESIKALPAEFDEVSKLYGMSTFERLTKIYLPAAMPRVVEQSVLSWAIGLFYLVTSEIFSTGSAVYQVKYGIGSQLTQLALGGNTEGYVLGLAVFILFVVATRFLFFAPLERYVTRYNAETQRVEEPKFSDRVKSSILHNRLIRVPHIVIKMRHKAGSVARRSIDSINIHNGPGRMSAVESSIKRHATLIAVVAILAVIAAVFLQNNLISYEAEALAALAISFARVWITFAMILLVSVPLCIYLVFKAKNSNSYLLFFQVLASIPATILMPIIVEALKGYPMHNEAIAIAVFFLSGIWYVVFSIIASTKTLPASVFEVKKLFFVNGHNAFKNIYMKAIFPGLVTGAVTAIAAEWNASIVAEYFTSNAASGGTVLSAVQYGMGKLLDTALSANNLVLMFVALLNLVAMILIINSLVWKRLYNKISVIYS
ncbi:MAG: ABC transporter permease subunit [Candidatus Micrarchaeota archaeon]|nr:ABC transporter permease subunit [Candidatus Micrarchaeota archaeon]